MAVRANAGKLDADQLDTDWIISPDTNLPVPWIWIRALSAAWERYKTEGGPLGRAFGLEGGGQGMIETMKGPAESGQICSVGRRKIAKKIAKNKRCYANTLRPCSRMLLKVMKGG